LPVEPSADDASGELIWRRHFFLEDPGHIVVPVSPEKDSPSVQDEVAR
jgi:hypothetical protein